MHIRDQIKSYALISESCCFAPPSLLQLRTSTRSRSIFFFKCHCPWMEEDVKEQSKYVTNMESSNGNKIRTWLQTWNHLAWRRDAKAERHFCLSRTSGGSLTVCVSIVEVGKKKRYSLTKGVGSVLQLREKERHWKPAGAGNWSLGHLQVQMFV